VKAAEIPAPVPAIAPAVAEAPVLAPDEDLPAWKTIRDYVANPGEYYTDVVKRWVQEADLPLKTVAVKGDDDCRQLTPMKFHTDLKTAVSRLTLGFQTANPPPIVDFYDDGENFAILLTVGHIE
jgi:hypothetical protein